MQLDKFLPVAEHFVSINGEGQKSGQLAIFIRFTGCNLKCNYCDTTWANMPDAPFEKMTIDEIWRSCKAKRCKQCNAHGRRTSFCSRL